MSLIRQNPVPGQLLSLGRELGLVISVRPWSNGKEADGLGASWTVVAIRSGTALVRNLDIFESDLFELLAGPCP